MASAISGIKSNNQHKTMKSGVGSKTAIEIEGLPLSDNSTTSLSFQIQWSKELFWTRQRPRIRGRSYEMPLREEDVVSLIEVAEMLENKNNNNANLGAPPSVIGGNILTLNKDFKKYLNGKIAELRKSLLHPVELHPVLEGIEIRGPKDLSVR